MLYPVEQWPLGSRFFDQWAEWRIDLPIGGDLSGYKKLELRKC